MSTLSSVAGAQYEAGALPVSGAEDTAKTKKKTRVTGKTIGQPELSEKAQKYYEKLKTKYSNMDFILVSTDMKETAKAHAGSYANANRMVVLIDEEKIERMAEDETFRKQYESIIANAANKMPQIMSKMSASGANVKTVGMQVNDNGLASYFAVVDKSFASQRERMAKKAEQKKADKKAAAKKQAKEAEAERLEERRRSRRAEDSLEEDENLVTVTASSIEELIRKVQDVMYEGMSDNARTESEKSVGQHVDFWG